MVRRYPAGLRLVVDPSYRRWAMRIGALMLAVLTLLRYLRASPMPPDADGVRSAGCA